MNEEIIPYSYTPVSAPVRASGKNYLVGGNAGLPSVRLVRDTDFGVIPGTSKPSLFKAGAEKIATCYGLCQRYEIVDQAADHKTPFYYYLVRCDLVKIIDGREYVIVSAYGSSNTNERRNGRNSPYDAANGTIKMAQKRALVGAVLALCSGSDMFTQDIEDEKFMQQADNITKADPEAPITKNQITRLYAVAGDIGLTAAEAKKRLNAMGYSSTKAIKQGDYDAVIEKLKEGDTVGG